MASGQDQSRLHRQAQASPSQQATATATQEQATPSLSTPKLSAASPSKLLEAATSAPRPQEQAFTIQITALNQNGNPFTGYPATSLTLTASTGIVSPASTGTSGWSKGVWTGTVTLTTAGSDIRITASDGSDTQE